MKKQKILKLVPIFVILILVLTFALLLSMKSKINKKAANDLDEKRKTVNNTVQTN